MIIARLNTLLGYCCDAMALYSEKYWKEKLQASRAGGNCYLRIAGSKPAARFVAGVLLPVSTLRHEVSPFGIHASVIEPGVIKTHIMEGGPVAKKSLENSAYSEITQAIGKTMGEMMENQSSPPIVVAEAVLVAATTENPETRYTAGEDAKMIQQARKTKSDQEFEDFIRTNFVSID